MHAVCEGVSTEGPFTLEEGEVQCTFAPGGAEDCCETCDVCVQGGHLVPTDEAFCKPAVPGDQCGTAGTPPDPAALHSVLLSML